MLGELNSVQFVVCFGGWFVVGFGLVCGLWLVLVCGWFVVCGWFGV